MKLLQVRASVVCRCLCLGCVMLPLPGAQWRHKPTSGSQGSRQHHPSADPPTPVPRSLPLLPSATRRVRTSTSSWPKQMHSNGPRPSSASTEPNGVCQAAHTRQPPASAIAQDRLNTNSDRSRHIHAFVFCSSILRMSRPCNPRYHAHAAVALPPAVTGGTAASGQPTPPQRLTPRPAWQRAAPC